MFKRSSWCFIYVLPLLISCQQNSKTKNAVYGQIDADEIDVASRLAGRISKVLVAPGQQVKAGDPLVEFDDDIISAEKNRALALIKAAESQQSIAQHATRPEEKAQLKAGLDAAEKQLEFAKTTLERIKKLAKEGAVSQQQLDDATTKQGMANDAYNAAKAKFEMGEQGARQEQKNAASALVEEAKTGLAKINAYSSDLRLTSPVDAEVVKILNQEGEIVPTGYPVITLSKVNKPWAIFYVTEEKVTELTTGKEVKVALPFLKKSLSAKISFISPVGSFATLVTTQDRSAFDLKTFEVRAELSGDLAGIRPGMTAILEK